MGVTGPQPVSLNRWTLLAFVLFCAVFAFWLAGGRPYSMERYLGALLESLTIYGATLVAVVVAARIAPMGLLPRALILGSAALVGVFAGYFASATGADLGEVQVDSRLRLLVAPLRFLPVAWLGVAWILMAEREGNAREALFEERMRDLELRRAANDARYSVLQSQVEPHFSSTRSPTCAACTASTRMPDAQCWGTCGDIWEMPALRCSAMRLRWKRMRALRRPT